MAIPSTIATIGAAQSAKTTQPAGATQPAGSAERLRVAARADSLRQGRAELAAGRTAEARDRAEGLLKQDPADRDAYLLAIDALNARRERAGALSVYRRFVGQGREDFVLLAPIARGELDLLVANPSPGLRDAAEALLARLKAESGEPAPPARDTKAFSTMARDPKSADRRAAGLSALVENESPDAKSAVIGALSDPDFQVRMAALNGVISLHAQEAAPALKAVLADPNPLVRVQAASALRRLGDPGGDAVLKAALTSPFRAGRLVAARALRETGDTSSWVSALTPLLDSPQPIERVMAAELLAGTSHREKAQSVLQDAMANQDELVREEASRVLTSEPSREQPPPFVALSDASPWVRLKATETVLFSPAVVAARKAAAAKPSAAQASPRPR